MPNRKTFDQGDKYDHSSHPVERPQPSDLQADVQHPGDRVVKGTPGDDTKPPARRVLKLRSRRSTRN